MRLVNRGIVPIGRTAVSKTDGCEFESCYPCHIQKKPSISSAFSYLKFDLYTSCFNHISQCLSKSEKFNFS